mgnify:CR=1 FL=1
MVKNQKYIKLAVKTKKLAVKLAEKLAVIFVLLWFNRFKTLQ